MVLALESADETPLFGQGAGQHRGGIHTERPAVVRRTFSSALRYRGHENSFG